MVWKNSTQTKIGLVWGMPRQDDENDEKDWKVREKVDKMIIN
jgi:hypothetical protein